MCTAPVRAARAVSSAPLCRRVAKSPLEEWEEAGQAEFVGPFLDSGIGRVAVPHKDVTPTSLGRWEVAKSTQTLDGNNVEAMGRFERQDCSDSRWKGWSRPELQMPLESINRMVRVQGTPKNHPHTGSPDCPDEEPQPWGNGNGNQQEINKRGLFAEILRIPSVNRKNWKNWKNYIFLELWLGPRSRYSYPKI